VGGGAPEKELLDAAVTVCAHQKKFDGPLLDEFDDLLFLFPPQDDDVVVDGVILEGALHSPAEIGGELRVLRHDEHRERPAGLVGEFGSNLEGMIAGGLPS